MAPAQVEKTVITIALSKSQDILQAKGEVVQFPGFLKVHGNLKNAEDGILPEVKNGDPLGLQNAAAEQVYSKSPARYTEASLVRKLEELGIGRPSTYAPTISTIQTRGYVEKADVVGGEREVIRLMLHEPGLPTENTQDSEALSGAQGGPPKNNVGSTEPVTLFLGNPGRRGSGTPQTETIGSFELTRAQALEPIPTDKNKLVPTDIGKVVTDFLVQNFPHVVDYDFTKNVEQEFDDIADGKMSWQTMLQHFYDPFHKTVEKSDDISRAEAMQARNLGDDPKTGKPITARFGRYGAMVQMGEAEDETQKPRFASIPKGLSIDTITLQQALELFKLPRQLGTTEDGETIEVNIGRFGPYVKIGKRYVNLGQNDPYSIDLATAQELIRADTEKRAKQTIQDFPEQGIRVLNGRYGPYITDGKKNAKIPKELDPAKLSLQECQDLLAKAPARGSRKRRVRN
jgi:DNA topoisomerase-1